jgi:hypothetical protein
MAEPFKGPWKVEHEALEVLAPHPKGAYVGGFTKVCDIRSWGFLTGKGALALPHDEAVAIQTANARLIAAAPEMLAALRAVAVVVNDLGRINRHGLTYNLVMDVLAKAEGR